MVTKLIKMVNLIPTDGYRLATKKDNKEYFSHNVYCSEEELSNWYEVTEDYAKKVEAEQKAEAEVEYLNDNKYE